MKNEKIVDLKDLRSFVDTRVLESCKDSGNNVCEFYADGRRRVSLDFSNDPGCTEQSHKSMCDLEMIINRHLMSGGLPPLPESTYVDLTNLPSYQEALNVVLTIESTFEQLPLKVRDAFGHDPEAFMAALHDPANKDHLIELGVFERPVEASVPPVTEALASVT